MFRLVTLFLLCTVIGTALASKPLSSRNSLCRLKYGQYENGEYTGSTPMEEACRTGDGKSREQICEQGYRKREIREACSDTYDAVTEQLRSVREKEH